MKLILVFVAICFIFIGCNSNKNSETVNNYKSDTLVEPRVDSDTIVNEIIEKEEVEAPVKLDTAESLGFLQMDSIQLKIKEFNSFDDGEMRIFSQASYYICYVEGSKKRINLQILFNEKDIALLAKYKKGTYGLELVHLGEEFLSGGSYPTIHNYYAELVKGKFNGMYKLTHSGNYEYANYTALEGTKFTFAANVEEGRPKDECLK